MPPKKTDPPKSPNRSEQTDILAAMTTWMEKIGKMISDGFERQLEVLQAETFQLKKDLEKERTERVKLEGQVKTLREEVKGFQGELNFLTEKLNSFEEESRKNDVVFDNIPVPSEMQDPSAFLKTFVNQTLMGEVIGDGDLVSTTVFRKRNTNKMTLIGKLKSPAIKKAILSQRKMFINKRIFVKENLSQYKYGLYQSARKAAQEAGFKFVWTRNGNVFIRRTENTEPILIRNHSVLNTLF